MGKRGSGKWTKISWKKAIATISDNLCRIREENGAKAVAFCQGMPKGLEHFVLIRLANIFGSPNLVACQDVCHAPGKSAAAIPAVFIRWQTFTTQFARLTETIKPGIVYAAYGWWFPEGRCEQQYKWKKSNFNILTFTRVLGKESGPPNMKGLRCRIRRKMQ